MRQVYFCFSGVMALADEFVSKACEVCMKAGMKKATHFETRIKSHLTFAVIMVYSTLYGRKSD